jgi:hypothetical protein
MSQENVETFKRGLDAYNRRDIDARRMRPWPCTSSRFRRSGTLGSKTLAIGRIRARGRESGVEIDSVFCALTESRGTKGRDTKAISLRTYSI